MCYHSNTADPVGPPSVPVVTPQQPNGQGTGGTPAPAKTIIKIEPKTMPTKYSKEGRAPILDELEVYVWYSDGGMETLGPGNFIAVPAVLGEAQLNQTNRQVAQKTTINIYHRDYPGPSAEITLLGVQALKGGYDRTNMTYSIRDKVVGNSGEGVDFVGDFNGVIFYEDDRPITNELLGRIGVYVQYEGLWDTDAHATAGADEGMLAAPSAGIERLWLTQDHIFTDYTTNFINDGTASVGTKIPYAYGVDPQSKTVNILISRGIQHGTKGLSEGNYPVDWNTSTYIRVPLDTYREIRGIEVKHLQWGNTEKPFVLQTNALGYSTSDWVGQLISGEIEIEVSYWGTADKQTRDKYDFNRAVLLGRAGVYNEPMYTVTTTNPPTRGAAKTTDDDDFADIVIGYYSSLPDTNYVKNWRDAIGKGDFTNAAILKVPVATFVESSGNLRYQANHNPKDKNLQMFHDWQNTAGVMSDTDLLTLQNAYEFWGDFRYDTYTEPAMIIPGVDFRKAFFTPPNPFRTTEPQGETVEVTFKLPNRQGLTRFATTGTAAPLNPFTGGAATARTQAQLNAILERYAVFAEEEATFSVDVRPRPNDVK